MDESSQPVSNHNVVRIFDTTLRDGEQSPGATLTSDEKVEIARSLSRLGVDVIEAGFPAASPDDLEAVKRIANTAGVEQVAARTTKLPPMVCGLARANPKDIDRCWEGVRDAARPRIHTFIATSPIHREHKLRMTKEQVIERARQMVAYARSLCRDVEFSAEDAGRTEPDFLYEVLSAVIAAGATTLNIPDTVGYTLPDEFGQLIASIIKNVPNVGETVISVHCHNDLGLATANTLAGIRAGARQAEVTVNGIGERAGNTALEEFVMALRTRHGLINLQTNIDSTQICKISKLVSTRTGVVVQPNKAVVGANAFAHEAGIHQDGILKHQATYEIMKPETVGATKSTLVLGKHSGRHAFGVRLRELGCALSDEALEAAFDRFKVLADKKKNITDADLEALAADEVDRGPERYALGTGPVHAVFTAIDNLLNSPAELIEYSINAVTEGIDALGEANVRVQAKNTGRAKVNPQHCSHSSIFHGHAADSDIIVASTKAYLVALNRLLSATENAANREPFSERPEPGASI